MPQTTNQNTTVVAEKKVVQLGQLCKENGINKYSKLRNADLIKH